MLLTWPGMGTASHHRCHLHHPWTLAWALSAPSPPPFFLLRPLLCSSMGKPCLGSSKPPPPPRVPPCRTYRPFTFGVLSPKLWLGSSRYLLLPRALWQEGGKALLVRKMEAWGGAWGRPSSGDVIREGSQVNPGPSTGKDHGSECREKIPTHVPGGFNVTLSPAGCHPPPTWMSPAPHSSVRLASRMWG